MSDPLTRIDDAMEQLKRSIAEAIAEVGDPFVPTPDLGELIRFRRETLGLTLDAVAKLAGCTKSHVWELEQGHARNPTVLMMHGLAQALQTPFVFMARAALASAVKPAPSRADRGEG